MQETAEKCSCLSRLPSRYKFPEATANVTQEIMEKPQMQVSNGEKHPLQKPWQLDDS